MNFRIIENTGAKRIIEAEDSSRRFIRDARYLRKVPSRKMKPGGFYHEEGEDVMDLQTSGLTNSEKLRGVRVIKPPPRLQDYDGRIDVWMESLTRRCMQGMIR